MTDSEGLFAVLFIVLPIAIVVRALLTIFLRRPGSKKYKVYAFSNCLTMLVYFGVGFLMLNGYYVPPNTVSLILLVLLVLDFLVSIIWRPGVFFEPHEGRR